MIAHLQRRERALAAFGLAGCRTARIVLASLHGGVLTRSQLLGLARGRPLQDAAASCGP